MKESNKKQEIETGYSLLNESQDLIHKRDPIEIGESRNRAHSTLGRLALRKKELEVVREPTLVQTDEFSFDLFIPEDEPTEPEIETLGVEDIICSFDEPREIKVEREATKKDAQRAIQENACDEVIIDLSSLTISPEPTPKCHIFGCLNLMGNPDISLLCPDHFARGIVEGWGSQDLFPPEGWLPPDFSKK